MKNRNPDAFKILITEINASEIKNNPIFDAKGKKIKRVMKKMCIIYSSSLVIILRISFNY